MHLQNDAYLWGVKAARAGIAAAENPYRRSLARATWLRGHASEHRSGPPRGIYGYLACC